MLESVSVYVCCSCFCGNKSAHNNELKTGGDKTILLLRFISFSFNFHKVDPLVCLTDICVSAYSLLNAVINIRNSINSLGWERNESQSNNKHKLKFHLIILYDLL